MVTASVLVSEILRSIDLAPIAGNALNFAEDMKRANEILQRIQSYWNNNFLKQTQFFGTLGLSSLNTMMQTIFSEVQNRISFTWLQHYNASIQSAAGFKLASNMLNLETKIYNALHGLDVLSSCIIDTPLEIVRQKAQRYWNAAIGHNFPDEQKLAYLANIGKSSWETVTDYLRQYKGYNLQYAKDLTEQLRQTIGKPSLKEAFIMYKKGLMNYSDFRQIARIGYGIDDETLNKFIDNWDYDVSPSELLRLSDLIDLSSEAGTQWIIKQLNAYAVPQDTQYIFLKALRKRTVKDEITRIWGILLDFAKYGIFSAEELKTLLKNWEYSENEINLRLNTVELIKTKYRIQMLINAEIYLYRQGQLSENDLLIRLTNLGVSKDIANAFVRLEAARKGIEWEMAND